MDITSNARLETTSVNQTDWEAIFHELLPKVFRFFAYRVGNRLVAEDLTAGTFERAWRRRTSYQHDMGAFSQWLFGIARNVAREHYRQRSDHLQLDETLPSTVGRQPENRIGRQEDYERLANLLAELPGRDQELIALKYGAEMTNREIAQVSGLSESNVGTILHRVVKKMQKQWEAADE